jgi:hypothetical protein
MSPSDWIAIAALGASVLISIAGFFFSYFTQKENIKARRAEIVAEKSIEVFRELVEKMNEFTHYVSMKVIMGSQVPPPKVVA